MFPHLALSSCTMSPHVFLAALSLAGLTERALLGRVPETTLEDGFCLRPLLWGDAAGADAGVPVIPEWLACSRRFTANAAHGSAARVRGEGVAGGQLPLVDASTAAWTFRFTEAVPTELLGVPVVSRTRLASPRPCCVMNDGIGRASARSRRSWTLCWRSDSNCASTASI